jgi:hypothetical protein
MFLKLVSLLRSYIQYILPFIVSKIVGSSLITTFTLYKDLKIK